MSEFDDIRPYNDTEIAEVLRRIVEDRECLDTIGQLRYPKYYGVLSWLIRPILRAYLRRQVAEVDSVYDFQMIVERYMSRMVADTTDGFSVSGLSALDLSQPCLFISNHRDITLDPAFTNYALHHEGGSNTVRIAIGDNLLSKPFASDLMRANKSFIVKRGIRAPRELLKALKKLSRYIYKSLREDGEHVWIAQREGRAKDGIDRTDPAILKMLLIAKPKTIEVADYIRSLRIVPVSVSYEYDPCDKEKARELTARQQDGEYLKSAHEDLESIGRGIAGQKGHVHLHFGHVITESFDDADALASYIDRQIIENYRIHPSNVVACNRLQYATIADTKHLLPINFDEAAIARAEQAFDRRVAEVPGNDVTAFLSMYANPVMERLALQKQAND